MVCICIAVLILQNEIQQHNHSNNGGEYQWQRVQQVIGSYHNNATMQQSNKSLPIQLVSKSNYNNEVMLPKYNSYFYDTTAA